MPIELTEKDFEDVPAFELSELDFLEEPVPVPALPARSTAPRFVSEPVMEPFGGLVAASRRWEEEAFKPLTEPPSISARDVGLMEKLRTGPVGRTLLGPTEAEKEAIAEGAMAGPSGGDIGLKNLADTMLRFTSVPPPLAENIRAGTKPLIGLLPEEVAGVARGVQESVLNLPIAPLPAGAGKAVLPIFGAEFLAGAPNAYEAYQQALARGDKGAAAQIATEQVLGGALLAAGGAHEAGLRLPSRTPPRLPSEQLRAPAAPEPPAARPTPEPAVPSVEAAKPAEPAAAAVPEAKPVSEALKDLPAVPEGKVRLYRGEGGAMPESSELGGEWYTTNPEKAAQFGPKLQYVDVTPEEAAAARQRAKDKGRGGDTVILTKENLAKTKPVPGEVAPKVHDLEAPVEAAQSLTKEAIEKQFAGQGMKKGVSDIIVEHQGNVTKLEEALDVAKKESEKVKADTESKYAEAKKNKDLATFSAINAERQKAGLKVQGLEEAVKYSKKLAEQATPAPEPKPAAAVEPAPAPAIPEPSSAQALGIAPQGTAIVQTAIDWVKDIPNKARIIRAQLAGKSAPRTSTASEASGNALVKYASSNITAPLLGRSMATEVLGERFKDNDFSQRLGAVLVEDRLRAIKDGFVKAGDADGARAVETTIGKDWSPFETEADFQAALNDPEIQAAIQRHKQTVQPTAQLQHEEAGGQLAGPGLNTGAFVNLKAIFPDAEEVPFRQGGRGNLENPLRRRTRFGKQAKGTAEQYETDYRTLAERMVSGNYAEYTKRQLYDQLVKDGLAQLLDPGEPAPEIGGRKAVKFTVERKGIPAGENKARTYIKNLWVREDIAPELRQALNTDGAVGRAGLAAAANLINRIQLAGPTDAVWHTANMLGSIAGSQGGRTVLADLARKLPGVNIADAVTRVVASGIRVLRDTPEIQKQLAELSEIGSMRAKPLTGNTLLDFNHRMIALVDRAGRLVRDDMYQNLVRRGLVQASEAGRREWVNQMGQYNGRMMGQFQRFFKEAGFSPFVVAGRNFNRMAMRRLTGDPGIKAASPAAALEMRAIEWLGTAATLVAIPSLINYFTTGNPSGRPGVKQGQIDTGKDKADGSHIVIDPAQWTGLRRGLRISGLQAVTEGIRRGETGKKISHEAIRDVLGGIIHPWAGPSVSAPVIAVTGYSPTAYRQSENPYDYGANTIAALKQLNPVAASIIRTQEKKGGEMFPKTWAESGSKGLTQAGELGMSLGGAAGVKGVRPYSPVQEMNEKVNQWMDERNLKPKGIRIEFTEDPSYHTLRRAIQDGSRERVQEIIKELQKTKSLRQIIDAQRTYADRPLTGSETHEREFLRSLSDADRALYWQAREQKKEELKKFYQMLP